MIIRSKAPLRLGLAGGGTDVSPFCDDYGGCVLNVTINMFAYCTIIPSNDNKIVIDSSDMNQHFECDSALKLDTNDKTCLLHKGVYNRIIKEFNIDKPLSFKMTTYSDAPSGSGLGTSSTMVVAILKVFQEWLNLPLGEYDTAKLAYEIERQDLNFLGGKQDQYAATFGGFNFIEFYKNDRVIVNPLRLKKWIKNEVENSIILFYTGTSRDSGKIIKQQTKAIEDVNSLNAMKEIKKQTYLMKEAFLKGDFDSIAKCLNLNWEAKKRTSTIISNKDIENIYNYVIRNGAKAAKITGAGGGGFMIIWCDPKDRYNLVCKLKELEKGFIKTINFVDYGTQAWTIYD